MTRVLIFPDDQHLYILETSLPPARLAQILGTADWPELDHHLPGAPAWLKTAALQTRLLGQNALLVFLDTPPPVDPLLEPRRRLTRRQRDVLRCLADGLPVKSIAMRLGLSERAVGYHISALRERLRVETTAQAVARAAQLGLFANRRRSKPGD